MILSFSDAHLGYRGYGSQNSSGVFSSEEDTLRAFEGIYSRSQKDDIDMIIFCGDWFHTNHPTSLNVSSSIEFIQKMDSLYKPFFLIPGNHDASMYSNGIVFTHKLSLENTTLCDRIGGIPIVWGKWKIRFVPYIPNTTFKEKDKIIDTAVMHAIENSTEPTIIVTHIHEISSRIGSEASMISKGVDVINCDTMRKDNIIILTGHIHRRQSYVKGNGITIVYPGSLTYLDYSDVDQGKGYVLIDEHGTIKFEDIPGIRKFVRYTVPETMMPLDFLKSTRLLANSVIFIKYDSEIPVREEDIREYLKTRSCFLGKVYYRSSSTGEDHGAIDVSSNSPEILLSNYYTNYFENSDFDWKSILLPKTLGYLERTLSDEN